MKKYKDYWNKMYKDNFDGIITCDNWLSPFKRIIEVSNEEIIDLGCGMGNNSLYVSSLGKKVIACDYSEEALRIVSENLDNKFVRTMNFDMTEGLPFLNDQAELVIADLSLHYFDRIKTFEILQEIKRILTKEGHMIFRVNSTSNVDNSFFPKQELEENYYFIDGYKKRFFDEKSLLSFFKDWEILSLNEEKMERYKLSKNVWKGLVRNRK